MCVRTTTYGNEFADLPVFYFIEIIATCYWASTSTSDKYGYVIVIDLHHVTRARARASCIVATCNIAIATYYLLCMHIYVYKSLPGYLVVGCYAYLQLATCNLQQRMNRSTVCFCLFVFVTLCQPAGLRYRYQRLCDFVRYARPKSA